MHPWEGLLAYCALTYYSALCVTVLCWHRLQKLNAIVVTLFAPVVFGFLILVWTIGLFRDAMVVKDE